MRRVQYNDEWGGIPVAYRLGGALLRAGLLAVLWPATAGCAREQRPAPESQASAAEPGVTQSNALQPATAPSVAVDERGELRWDRPRTNERQGERDRMVREQIVGRGLLEPGITDPRVVAALRAVPRHAFVPAERQARAYDDTSLPIGHGQTISQPYIVALMTDLLRVKAGDRVLEIGTGSGYQAAVLAELTPHVFTIEIVAPLAEEAAARLKKLGYATVQVKQGDGYAGWPEQAPFDAILVTCSAEQVPGPLWDQLKCGGRMVIPMGGAMEMQRLRVVTKQADGSRRSEDVLPVLFVPMTGKAQGP